MADQHPEITEKLQKFIEHQKVFFVGTADVDGRVNVSPKGLDTFRIISPKRVMWLNLTGSGNETAAHIRNVNRITIMFCAFDGSPMILRLYGKAKAIHPQDPEWKEAASHLEILPGARQIFDVDVEVVQTSCGYAVPILDYREDRQVLTKWAEKKGPEGVREYWEQKNQVSFDGKPTGIFDSSDQ